MATETSTNGVYDDQFNQPAELAASTPSHVASSSQASNTQSNKADPQEIGWYFVEQYYTTLSKTPERIHLFYSKKSQLVTGVEAEKVVPAVGTKAISEKIKALDIQDCKVRVLNVDSQSSFDNIVVQVIGEMSNKSQPHHKFVQTFVLATQPNGYYVLNDIFRYLNDEEDEIVEDEPVAEEPAPVAEPTAEVEQPVEKKTAEEIVDTTEAVEAVDEKLEEIEEPTIAEEQGEAEKANGVSESVDTPEDTTAEAAESTKEESVAIPVEEQPSEPLPTPQSETPPKPASEQAQVPAAKKTWASLVGTSKPAIPALPAATPATSQPKVPRSTQSGQVPKPTAAAPVPASPVAQGDEWQTAESKKAKGTQPKSAVEAAVHGYIKNVTDKVDARELRRALEAFGELKYYDVSRGRNCAFIEFADPAGYAAAVAANPHDVNGESITVEERRPRPGYNSNSSNNNNSNNANFSRGGSNTGRGRGNFQGQGQPRTGGQGNFPKDGSRGGFQQRGSKSGNVTPKGRGQTQTA